MREHRRYNVDISEYTMSIALNLESHVLPTQKKNTINFLIEQIETNEPNISSWQYKHTKKIHISTAFRTQYFNQHLIEYSLRKRELWWIKPYSVLLSVAMLIFLKLFYIYTLRKKRNQDFQWKEKYATIKLKKLKSCSVHYQWKE